MKSISHTIYPDNYRTLTDRTFNQWHLYIAGIKAQNLPKKGGVNFEDEQEEVLNEYKNLLTLNRR